MPDGFDALAIMGEAAKGPMKPPAAAPVPAAAASDASPGAPAGFDAMAIMQQAAKGQFKAPEVVAAPAGEKKDGGGSVSGMGRQLLEGVGQGIVGMGNTINTMPNALIDLGTTAWNAVTGRSDQAPVTQPELPSPEPKGLGERYARAIGEGLPAAALMGPGALPSIVAGQVGGQTAAELAPDRLRQPAFIAGSMIGGMAPAAGKAAIQPAKNYLGEMGIGRKETLPTETGTIRATEPQIASAREQLVSAADQGAPRVEAPALPDGTPNPWYTPSGSERLATALENNQREIVPGSQPTTAQVAPLPGLAKLEDTLRTRGGSAFVARDAAQNAARIQAIQAARPETWDPAAIGQAFRDHFDALDQQGQQAIGTAQQGVNARVAALGDARPPDAVGADVRAAVNAPKQAERARLNRLYGAIDPDGTLALPVRSAQEAVRSVLAEMPQELTPLLGAKEKTLFSSIGDLPDVAKFSDIRKYTSAVGSAISEARRSGDEQAVRRLTIVKNALGDDIQSAAERIADRHAREIAAGTRAPEDSILGYLQREGANAGGVGAPAAGSGPTLAGQSAGGAAGAVGPAGVGGTPGPVGGAAGRGPGDRGLAAGEAAGGRKPETLVDFLISRGGVQDQGGELAANDLQGVHHRMGGRLVNPKGLTLDYAREAAAEAGFIRPNADINEFLNAVTSRQPVYRISEQADGMLRQRQGQQDLATSRALDQARYAVSGVEDEAGIRLNQAEHDAATRLVMEQGLHPEEAVRSVTAGTENAALQQHAERNAIGLPGVPAGAQQAEMPVGRAQLTPNLSAEKAAALNDANRQYRQFNQTFREGSVGQVLRSGGGAEFRLSDSGVGAKVWTPQGMREYLAATKGSPEALAAINDLALSRMRAAGVIDPAGNVNAGKLAGWMSKHSDTLEQVPTVRDRFSDVQSAQQALDQAQASHAAAVKEYQSGVAKNFLGADPDVAVSKALRSPDRVRNMQQIIGQVQGNADAMASLRGHVVDFILDRLTSSPKASEAHAAAPGSEMVGNLRPDTFKDWVADNKPWLRRVFGGQGMQNLVMVAADLQRQQTRGLASSGSPTAERSVGLLKTFAKEHAPTAMALLGEKLAEGGAAMLGMHGAGALGVEAVGLVAPILMHALHQKGVSTVNALVHEAMLNPDFARLLMTRTPDGKIGPVLQRRMAAALLAASATQEGQKQ